MDELVDHLAEALEAVDPLVAGIDEQQWSRSTPCTRWSVRDLVEHVDGGHQMFADIVRGAPMPSPEERGPTGGLGVDPLGTYRAAAYDVLAAFGEPGVLTTSFTLPTGSVPGVAAVHLRIVEALGHGWDLARATGQTIQVRDRIAELALDFSAQLLTGLPPGPGPFAPPQAVAVDAPVLERLAALLGRRTGSAPPG